MNSFPSKIFEEAVNEFSTLPGIGKRSAVRMVLHLLKQSPVEAKQFGETIIRLINEIRFCKNCHNLSDTEICSICADARRDQSLICVVEDVRDLLAVENTNQYRGLYHVLGGIISPMDGIGPSNLNIESLIGRLTAPPPPKGGIKNDYEIVAESNIHPLGERRTVNEIIMALSPTMEGDTTVFYLCKKIHQRCGDHLHLSTIARGISIGDDLEYADEVTLGRSILNRTPYESSFAR